MKSCCKDLLYEIIRLIDAKVSDVNSEGYCHSVKTSHKRVLLDFGVTLKQKYKVCEVNKEKKKLMFGK